MTTKYEAVKIWVDKKDYHRLKVKLTKEKKSLSHFFREKAKEYLQSKTK